MGDLGPVPGLGRCPGEGNGYPLQYSDLENSRGTWQATVHGVIMVEVRHNICQEPLWNGQDRKLAKKGNKGDKESNI